MLVGANLRQRREEFFARHAELLEDARRRGIALVEHGEVNVLHAGVFIAELPDALLSAGEHLAEAAAGIQLAAALHGGHLLQFALHRGRIGRDVHAHQLQKPRNEAVLLADEREVKMFNVQLLMLHGKGDRLRIRNRFLRALGEFVHIHINPPPLRLFGLTLIIFDFHSITPAFSKCKRF